MIRFEREHCNPIRYRRSDMNRFYQKLYMASKSSSSAPESRQSTTVPVAASDTNSHTSTTAAVDTSG
jgi:hypothetical protein